MNAVQQRPLMGTVGFRATTTVDESPRMRTQVAQAVARAKAGDKEAVRFLYVTYANNIYGYIRSIVNDDHEAEDLTQQVFAKLMTAVRKYDDRGVPFFAWLLRLARNLTIDYVRSNRAVPAEEIYERDVAVSHELDQSHAVQSALDSLPEEQRQVVIMRHVIGLTPGEIAERLGRSEGSIHGLHHRGRRALQRELRALGSMPQTRGTCARERERIA